MPIRFKINLSSGSTNKSITTGWVCAKQCENIFYSHTYVLVLKIRDVVASDMQNPRPTKIGHELKQIQLKFRLGNQQ